MELTIPPPAKVPFFLRPALALARRLTGKDPLPGRLLAHAPKVAFAAGLLEAFSAHAPGDLDARTLKLARLAASVVSGCPFCIDMNASGTDEAGVTRAEVAALFAEDDLAFEPRAQVAVALARAMSRTPCTLSDELRGRVSSTFTPREVVVLASACAQVNYWARLNQALGVPALGFTYEPGSSCAVPPGA